MVIIPAARTKGNGVPVRKKNLVILTVEIGPVHVVQEEV
jgi:hypothetical protein